MANEIATPSTSQAKSMSLPASAENTTDAALRLELLSICERVRRIWRERAQMEATLWSDFAIKLEATRTLTEGFDAYSRCLATRMQMASDDMRRLFEEYQEVSQEIVRQAARGCLADRPT
jgi:hypothetical protein